MMSSSVTISTPLIRQAGGQQATPRPHSRLPALIVLKVGVPVAHAHRHDEVHVTWQPIHLEEAPFPPRRLSSRGKNPYIVVKTRAKALKNALELDWAYLGTEIKLNAHITNPTFENEWDEWCRKYNRERIVASFDVECALREVFPEVTLP